MWTLVLVFRGVGALRVVDALSGGRCLSVLGPWGISPTLWGQHLSSNLASSPRARSGSACLNHLLSFGLS